MVSREDLARGRGSARRRTDWLGAARGGARNAGWGYLGMNREIRLVNPTIARAPRPMLARMALRITLTVRNVPIRRRPLRWKGLQRVSRMATCFSGPS